PDTETTVPAPAPATSRPGSGPGQGNAELAITVVPSPGAPGVSYTLVCSSGQPSPESSHPGAAAACAALKANPAIAAPAEPGPSQPCTQQYGGPQTATVTGMVDGVAVESKFARTNGCEISAWNAAKDVLGASGGAS
ncbi:SSI family serine proteinase inhibitor, partial [Pseudarthrobacter sp. C4D7]|uniref:SSI family serine proteinase inhibitor n=1 Tax=Pseudarthrobacter sp. C4D7 TaxID=2735268 RepID=UPI0015856D6B